MTRPRISHDTQFARTVACPVQAACDGNALTQGRVAKGICVKCEEALNRRGKTIPPKGMNTAVSEADRKVDALRKAKEKNNGD